MIVDDMKNNIKALSSILKKFENKYHLNLFKIEDGNLAVDLFMDKNS